MPADYGVRDFFEAARTRREELKTEIRELEAEIAAGRSRQRELEGRVTAAFADLGAALVPDFTVPSFERAARLAGYRKLVAEDPIGVRERERSGLQEWIAKFEADPRFRDRVKLRDPRVGVLTRQIAELEEFRAAPAETVQRCEHPRLARLVESGYGTDRYDVPFWRLSYYADWKAGDEILEKWPEKKEFAEVREEYLAAKGQLDSYDRRLDSLRSEMRAGEELEKKHRAATESLATLDERHLKQAQEAVARHVADSPPAAIGPLLAGDPHVELLAKKALGLVHQRDYHAALADRQLQPMLRRLREEDAKLARDQVKYMRPKKAWTRFPAAKFEKRFHGRHVKFTKFRDRYRRTHETVYTFDDYGRGRFVEDFLWWDVVTDGRFDGDFIPEVSRFRQEHPGYRYERDLDDRDAATAVADADRFADDNRSFDAS